MTRTSVKTTFKYDAGGQLVTVVDPEGGVTRYTYDGAGRMLILTDARGITFLTNEYDTAGRVIRQTQADSGLWQFAYTATAGLITQTTVTDPRGHLTTSRFNGQGYQVGQTDAVGQVTTTTRDATTNLVQSSTDTLGRKKWNEFMATLKRSPGAREQRQFAENDSKLRGKTFWTIFYNPKPVQGSRPKGGGGVVFVDAKTGKVLLVIRGE